MAQPTERSNLLTGEMLAKLLELTPARVSQLTKESILPREQGKYPLVPSIQAYIRYLKKGRDDDEFLSLTAEKAKLTRAQREKAELELAVLRDAYLPVEQVEDAMAELAKILIASIEPLADRLERKAGLSPPQVEQVEQVVRGVRTEIAERLRRLETDA